MYLNSGHDSHSYTLLQCLLLQGDKDKIVGFKVRQVLASVKAQPGQIGFMRSVKVSIAAQCPNGRSLNTSCVNASDKLDTGVVEKNMTYK